MSRPAAAPSERAPRVVEVFADVACPFTHVGLTRFVERRVVEQSNVRLWIRAWPLEIVNGQPLSAKTVAEEIRALRITVAPHLFEGFSEAAFPRSSIPALALTAHAYAAGVEVGEQVGLELRQLLFERGVDIADAELLDEVATRHGLAPVPSSAEIVMAEHAEGARRGVIGSPHYFTPAGGFFCPSLEIERDADGHFRVTADPEGFERFVSAALA